MQMTKKKIESLEDPQNNPEGFAQIINRNLFQHFKKESLQRQCK